MNFADVKDWVIPQGNVTKVIDSNSRVIWEKSQIDYSIPFYVANITNSVETLAIKKYGNFAPTLTIEWSSDKVNWFNLGTTSSTAITKTLQPGQLVYLRCDTTGWGYNYDGQSYNRIEGVSMVGGNIMSLLWGANFENNREMRQQQMSFNNLCQGNTLLLRAENLILPSDNALAYCYNDMFFGCTNLETAPALPATNLFPACYQRMFNSTAITTAPVLPAKKLADWCYNNMFRQCANLNSVTCLATEGFNTTNSATSTWLQNVSATGTFIKKTEAVDWQIGPSGIPNDWTVINI